METRPFRLTSAYSPAGDQPRAIAQLLEAYHDGKERLSLLGVTGSGKTYTMASFITGINRPTLILSHNKTLCAQLYREFREFFPDNAVEYFVSYYDYYQPEAYVPGSDTYIEKDASVNDEIDRLRLRATSALLERDDVVIVASVSSIYGLGSPEDYRHSLLMLERGLTVEREDVMRQLLYIQYSRNDIAFTRGTFRVRGDTVEIFPAYRQEGVRVEWFGDEVDTISLFDPLTGKTLEKLGRIVVYPAKHFITSPPRLKEAQVTIEAELQQRLAELRENGKLLEAERLESRCRYDMEMLNEMGYCNGIENYSRHLTGRAPGEPPACLLDYFPEEFLVIVDESHVTLPQVRGMFAGDRSRKQTLVDFGFRLPSALDNRPLNFDEFTRMAHRILYVSATPGDYENQQAELIVEQIIRPTGLLDPVIEVRPTAGQIEDLLREIRLRSECDERVLITTLTKKMSEDLTDYLLDAGIRVAWLHSEVETIERVEIIRDLRRGTFEAVVGVNLLREGLDIPEVSLVAILDADKEGFLRNTRSLIQTIGRAGRNSNGKAILYADKVTPSMAAAISETDRRREIQRQHNEKHNITPQTIRKEIQDILVREIGDADQEIELLTEIESLLPAAATATSKKDQIDLLRREMFAAAERMEFEKAALLRDHIVRLETGKDPRETSDRQPPRQQRGRRRSKK